MLAENTANQASAPTDASSADIPVTSNLATISDLEPPPETAPPSTPTATETALPTTTPTATATPTLTPTAPPTATPLPEGWVFSGVRLSDDQDRPSLLLYGDLTNNTGAPQDLAFITGTFYDAQGQPLPDRLKFVDWPIELIAQGGRIPFALTVTGLQNVANFDLKVEARPSSDTLRQDFEFLDLYPANEPGNYCVAGRLRNPGSELHSFLTIVAVLYDGQDQVVNFNDYYEYYPHDLMDEQTMDFEVCVDPLNYEVARYELRAWGL